MIRPQGRPLDRGDDVIAVERLRPRVAGVAKRGVEGAAAIELHGPHHRVAVDGRQHVRGRPGLGREAVPLVAADPAAGEALRGRVALDQHRLTLERPLPVALEARTAEQLAVERPVAVGVGRRVNRHDAAAGPHPALQRRALSPAQHAAAVRLKQHHDIDIAEPLVAEPRRVLGQLGAEPLLECLAAGLDRVGVAVRGGSREDEHVDLRLVATTTGRDRQREDRGANPHGWRCYALTLGSTTRHGGRLAGWSA
jgi:hypothetical protein